MTYADAPQYIYGFVRYSKGGHTKDTPQSVALKTIRTLLNKLDNPQQHYPIIHIAGTKGKGSVSAMCAAMLQAAGYKVGLYTSPHLQDMRERFTINQTLISETEFIKLVEKLRPVFDATPAPTYFEVITALALAYFRQEHVDIAIVEAGVGGRVDATNVVNPILSIITSISLDHTTLLGDTVEAIATEKAGIIKPNIPIISAPQSDSVIQRLATHAQIQNAPFTLIGQDWLLEALPPVTTPTPQLQFRAAPIHGDFTTYQTTLLGAHQAINGTVALAAMHHLRQKGFNISEQAIQNGLLNVNWAGRMEILKRDHKPTVVLDSAHNLASAEFLQQALDDYFPNRPIVLVFGAKSNKDIAMMLATLLPQMDRLILTQTSDTSTEVPAYIADLATSLNYRKPMQVIPNITDALETADQLAPNNAIICITGSVYLIGEARSHYHLPIAQSIQQPNNRTPQ